MTGGNRSWIDQGGGTDGVTSCCCSVWCLRSLVREAFTGLGWSSRSCPVRAGRASRAGLGGTDTDSPSNIPFFLTTRQRFILLSLSVKTCALTVPELPPQLFLLGRANTDPLPAPPARLPAPPPPARHPPDHRAITRDLGNPEEIQSLKGLGPGRGAPSGRAPAGPPEGGAPGSQSDS